MNFQVTRQLEDIISSNDYITPEIHTPGYNSFPSDVYSDQTYVENRHVAISFSAILLLLYISGVILFLIRFLRNLYIIVQKTRISEKISFESYRIVLTNDKTVPCCFSKSVFLNKDDYLKGRIDKELLDHELEHVRQSHTIDIILIELVKIFYWFNPVHLLYDWAIRINHEYLADNGVISDDHNVENYACKLLSFITGRSNLSLTSGSNYSYTKMRLMMMTKPRSGSFIYGAKITMALCLGIVLFLSLSFKESDKQPLKSILSEEGTEITQNIIRGIVTTVDGKPLFGATITSTDTINKSFKVTTGFDGRFTMNDLQPGSLLLIEYRGFIARTIMADSESEMVIKLVRDPDYKGKVIIPVIQNVNFRNSDFTPAKTLLVINGQIIDYNGNLRVNPGEIKSFKVLKDKEAIGKYGDKAKDGAIEILLYENKIGYTGKKLSNNNASDTSRYKTLLDINHVDNKGDFIDIPVSNLQYVSVWTYHDIDKTDKKELRLIGIMTRDYFKVKGKTVMESGKPLPGVKVSATDNPVTEISDKNGRFLLEDVREGALLEFSLQGYKPYYLSTSFEVAFNIELTIELRKDNIREKDDIYVKAEIMPQYPGGDTELRKFIITNVDYPQAAIEQKVKGTMIVRFVVNKKGKIQNVEILQRLHPELDAEVLRVVGELGQFIPGSQGGKPVDVYYTLPVTFAF